MDFRIVSRVYYLPFTHTIMKTNIPNLRLKILVFECRVLLSRLLLSRLLYDFIAFPNALYLKFRSLLHRSTPPDNRVFLHLLVLNQQENRSLSTPVYTLTGKKIVLLLTIELSNTSLYVFTRQENR